MSTIDAWADEVIALSEEGRRKSAIRKVVAWVPLLSRVGGGEGARFCIKVDITPDALTLTGLNENYTQAKGAREYFSRQEEENPAAMCAFFSELIMRAIREVPRKESR
jgi:hypothetical protein